MVNLQTANITEQQVIVAFHSFLQGALAQAHAEHLLDTSILASAEADIQIQGPAICLFLAALRSQGDPPSINTSLIHLDQNNCPPSFKNWFRLWAESVPQIKALSPDQRHDLARIICDQEPESQPILIELPTIARNLRAVAIEISQRRTFQERFHEDLDYAIQFGRASDQSQQTSPVTAQFRPPPAYEDTVTSQPLKVDPKLNGHDLRRPSHTNSLHLNRPTPVQEGHDALRVIRETLYASLADVVYSTPTIHETLNSKQSTNGQLSRAYFAALCLAILEVTLTLVDLRTLCVKVVHLGNGFPTVMRAEDCPPHLQPLVSHLFSIASSTQALADEDDQEAIKSANSVDPMGTRSIEQYTKIERLRIELERGSNWETGPNSIGIDQRAISPTGNVRSAANQINAHALRVSQIESFREREQALFEVLVPTLSERQNKRRIDH